MAPSTAVAHTSTAPSPLRAALKSPRFYLDQGHALAPLDVLCPGVKTTAIRPAPALEVALKVLWTFNLRAGELLGLLASSILPGDRVAFLGSKRSGGGVLFLPGLSADFPPWTWTDSSLRIFPFSFWKLWHWAGLMGLAIPGRRGKHQVVTHRSRHFVAQAVKKSLGEGAASDALRHKSRSSVAAYLLKKEQ